jgi:hypothetical protein
VRAKLNAKKVAAFFSLRFSLFEKPGSDQPLFDMNKYRANPGIDLEEDQEKYDCDL